MTFLSFCWLKETGANIFNGGQTISTATVMIFNNHANIQRIFYRCSLVLRWVSHQHGVAHQLVDELVQHPKQMGTSGRVLWPPKEFEVEIHSHIHFVYNFFSW